MSWFCILGTGQAWAQRLRHKGGENRNADGGQDSAVKNDADDRLQGVVTKADHNVLLLMCPGGGGALTGLTSLRVVAGCVPVHVDNQ